MGFRYNTTPPPKPEDHLRRFAVRNGAIMRVSFGCYYFSRGHDPRYHDYINWPAPNYHPGEICQMDPPRSIAPWMRNPKPGMPIQLDAIHLTEEGYTDIAVSYEDSDNAAYLTTEAWIDEDDDYIVHMKVNANFATFSDKPKDLRFTVFAKKSDGSAIDAICHGIVTVLPGSPYPTE